MIFQVEGVGEVVKEIGLFDMEKRRKAGEVVRKTTRRVGKVSRSMAPVAPPGHVGKYDKSGDLKASIRARYYHGDLISVTIPRLPKGWTRNFMEKGTVKRTTKKGLNRGKITPRPFMGPARTQSQPYFNTEMRKVWMDGDTVI